MTGIWQPYAIKKSTMGIPDDYFTIIAIISSFREIIAIIANLKQSLPHSHYLSIIFTSIWTSIFTIVWIAIFTFITLFMPWLLFHCYFSYYFTLQIMANSTGISYVLYTSTIWPRQEYILVYIYNVNTLLVYYSAVCASVDLYNLTYLYILCQVDPIMTRMICFQLHPPSWPAAAWKAANLLLPLFWHKALEFKHNGV